MARVIVVYGTTDGQTHKVADAIGATLREGGVSVDLFEASKHTPGPADYDAVIVAGSVHAGGYQRNLRRWVRRHAEDLQRVPNAFVSVCLGVLQHDPNVDRDLQSIRERFFEATGWHPDTVKVVAGALRYTRYNWVEKLAMQHIVAKAGGDTDINRDYEYTDWYDVELFARGFAGVIASRPAEAVA